MKKVFENTQHDDTIKENSIAKLVSTLKKIA